MAYTIGLHSLHQREKYITDLALMGEEIYVCLRGRVLFKLVPVSKPVRPHFINSDADEAEIRARSSGEVDSKEG